MWETVDRRVLGALRVVDISTGLPIRAPVAVDAEGLRLVRNRRGDYVIFGAAGLEAHTHAFAQPPAAPPLEATTFPLEIRDLSGRYLPRRSALKLPRDPDPKAANSIFVPAPVALFPAPSAVTELSWAVIRATVRALGSGARLPWALIRVLDATQDTVLAMGLADARGEALVTVPGILITMPADDSGPVLTTELEVKLTVAFDDTLSTLTDADLTAGKTGFNRGYVPNPDELSGLGAKAAQLQVNGTAVSVATGKLAAGRTLVTDLLVTLA